MPSQPPIELVWFRWKRPRAGSVHIDARARDEAGSGTVWRWLVVSADEGSTYDPFAVEPSLFRHFAELPPFGPGDAFERAVVRFAETWGLLGIEALSIVETEGAQLRVPAEPLDMWIAEARAMRAAVELFDAVQKKAYDRLREWITEREGGQARVYRYRRNDAQGSIGGAVLVGHRATDQLRGFLAAARSLLWAEFINRRLREHVSLVGVLDRGSRRTRLQAVPQNLLGALWLALARAVDDNRRYRRCGYRHCQKWIEITGTFAGHTRTRRFCSDAHRVYEHQRRHPKPKRRSTGGRR